MSCLVRSSQQALNKRASVSLTFSSSTVRGVVPLAIYQNHKEAFKDRWLNSSSQNSDLPYLEMCILKSSRIDVQSGHLCVCRREG